MLGLAHTLVVENRHDAAFLERYCVGFDRVRPYLLGATDGQPKDATWAAALTDIPADTIRSLARRMVAVRTMITVSWSVQRADHGKQSYWAAITLAALLARISHETSRKRRSPVA
jgi:biotin/methionine sulfoxide reductase